jgi:WD repeat-containing protein 55
VKHPSAVDCLYALDDTMACTGSSDGMIRVVNILPNSLVGVLGDHGRHPIERIIADKDRTRLISCGHDGSVKVWNLSMLLGEKDDLDSGDEDKHRSRDQTHAKRDIKGSLSQRPTNSKRAKIDDFFSGLS